ncbi:ShlB/FhaC/HecB family hemolysin secretion/activation protein [Paraburkholderia sp. BCC1886]|uniref:ShlB/FhaC/HecB family hemolysin secretion/activation protein n=1 Tax=Paraburkholderia sp. BCC1886 TaxID=2562670 RepID=UPI00164306F7|nr:ShlB/FhaC/HecB family hemolysin secretion/activation protein [Paraburkholderia sp. BCC1886]
MLTLAAAPAWAAELNNPVDHALQDQQQQRLLDEARLLREGLSRRDAPAVTRAPRDTGAQAGFTPQGVSCIYASGVEFPGATLVPDSLRQAIVLETSGKCLDNAALAHLLDEVNDWYVEHGYITSHAWLPQQDGAGGPLVIAAAEGKLGRVAFEDGTTRSDRAARMAFPGYTGEPLNLRDVEQGVDQLERVTPGGVKVAVRAAPEAGYSDVVVTGRTAPSVNVDLNVDNLGAANTGAGEFGGALTLNNMLGLGEQLGVSGTSTTALHGDKYRRSFGASASVPLGYWTLGYAGATGNFAIPLDFYGTPLRYHGSNIQNQISLSRTVSRNASHKIDVVGSLANYTGKTSLEDVQLGSGTERVSTARIGVNFASRVGTRSYVTFSPAVTEGLPFASADKSAAGGPSAGFRKFSASASVYTQVAPSVALLSSAYAQASARPLYSSERISVGGDNSVRGFKDQYLYGNTGAYLRNEVDWTPAASVFGARVTLMAALDAGRVVPVAGEPNSGGNVVGAALGASTSIKGVSASVSIGTPLFAPKQLHADPVVVNLRLSTRF